MPGEIVEITTAKAVILGYLFRLDERFAVTGTSICRSPSP